MSFAADPRELGRVILPVKITGCPTDPLHVLLRRAHATAWERCHRLPCVVRLSLWVDTESTELLHLLLDVFRDVEGGR